ncbi:MAG: hypothetical protein GY738_26165 [Pseudoalteromonas sp.]|nr:hypothetical protein [Pseudoalteromonas sp.]
MKTVTHEGKVYQIGGSYEFSDDGKWGQLGVLNNYDAKGNSLGGKFQSKTGSKFEWFKHIRLQQAPVGTITEAPVELIDGECYQFTALSSIVRKGFFSKPGNTFVTVVGEVSKAACANIKPLTVEK